MKNSKRAHRILAWLLTMTLIFTMSFSSIAYAADADTAGGTEGTNTEATTMDTSEEQTSDPAEDTANTQQAAEAEETQNPEALGEEAETATANDEKYVAAIGDQGYETLEAAAEAAPEGATIKLLKDIDMAGGLNIKKSVTLNLAGKEVSFSGENCICVNGADLTIKDSEDNKGKIYTEDYGIYAKNGGSVTVDGGTIDSAYAALGANNTTGDANFTINGGVLTSRLSEAIYMPSQQDIVIKGGTLNGGISARMGQITITGGTINGMRAKQTADSMDKYWNYSGSAWIGDAIYVWGGTYNSENENGNSCNINISGGTINGNAHNAIAVYDIANNHNQNVKVNISGTANINGEVVVDDTYKVSNPKNVEIGISVTGGTFSVKPKADFISEGYEAKKTGDSWTVDTIKVAKSGENEYASLEDAVENVKDGGEITLLQDVSEKLKIDNSKTFTIDLNGKAYTGGYISLHRGFVTVKNGTLKVTSWVYASDQDDQYNSLTVEKDVVIDGPDYGIVSYQNAEGKDNYGSTINFHGTMKNVQNGIWVLGNIHTDLEKANNPIVINVDGTISAVSKGNAAVALNGSAIMNIEKGTSIEGATAVEVRAGKLTVNDGALTGTVVPTKVTPNGNGTATLGAGIAIAQHTTALPIEVTVNGGTIEGYTGLLVTNPENRGNADKVKVTVKGGSFKTIKGGKNSIAKEDNAAGMTLLVNGGYFSDSSADNYLAASKTLVESDKSEFTYMVADKKTAAEADVDIKAAVGNVVVDKKTPDAVKEAIAGTTVSEKALDAAVKRELNKDVAVNTEDVNAAITSGVENGVFAKKPEADDVTVFAQAFLNIKVANEKDFDGGENAKCVLDITPMYQLVATTANSADSINIGTNAVVIGKPQELKINTAVEVTVPLPDGFIPKDDNTVTIKHTKSDGTVYYYSAEVTATADGKRVATFTNPNGFSTFEVLKLSDNTKLDKVELTSEGKSIETDIKANQLEYDIKFDAEKNVKDLTVNVAATANDGNAKIKVLVGGSEVKGKFVDLGLGTTTFNVLVLSEDDTAVLYTFNVIRCELVDDVTLNKDTFTYNGKAQAPAVTVKTAAGTTLMNGDAYTVSYKGNRTSVGTHTVTVLCKGNYEGEISKNYTINPAKPAIKKIKSSKRKMKVYMTTKPGSNGAEYYKISYRQKGTSTWKSTTATSSSKTIKGLKKGKRYYVKVCAYTGSYKSDDSTTKLSKKIR